MSSQQSFDPSLVEQARNQIRTIVNEITQLSKLDIVPDEYHGEFLHRVVSAMNALGGAIWTFEEGTLTLSYQVNFKELGLQSDENAARKHARLLYRMLHGPETGTLIPPHAGIEGEEESGNPTDRLLIFCPIRTELEVVGLVEVIQRPDIALSTQQGFLRFLAQVCILATDYYKNRQLRNFGERQNLWTQLEEFTRTIHQSLDARETTYTIANEGRRLIECDRVSLALRYGNRCKIVAVSGQDTVDKRSTTVRLLGKLATAVVRAGEPVWYTGDTVDFAPQVEKAVENYVDEAHTKMIAVFPLVRKPKTDSETEDDPSRRGKAEKPFGALLVEQIEDSRVPERMRKRVEIVAEHARSALGNALEHQSIFLMPLWKTLGKSKLLFTARTLPKTLLVVALIALVAGVLTFLPWKFLMHADATVEPTVRQTVFAPVDAEVKELFVDHKTEVRGPFVQDGQLYCTPLVELYSPELESQGIQLLGERLEIEEQLASLNRQKQDPDKELKESDRTELFGKIQQAEIRLENNQKRYEIYLKQLEDLLVVAPIDGTVITLDVKEKLTEKRPVSRMQALMEVADLKGPWQLEVAMPEKRMGHIVNHWNKLRETDPNARLRVEFVMATDPDVKYYGTVMEGGIHDRAEVRSDQGSAAAASSSLNTVLIKVALDDDPAKRPPSLRPGSGCLAKVDCGERPLGYVLFHEAIAFVQKNVFFRWF